VRSARTLFAMDKDECERMSIPEWDRYRDVRVDDAKNNIGRRDPKTYWFEISGQDLGNKGNIGYIKAWDPARTDEIIGLLGENIIQQIISILGSDYYYMDGKGSESAISLIKDTAGSVIKNEYQCIGLINRLVGMKRLKKEQIIDDKGKNRERLAPERN